MAEKGVVLLLMLVLFISGVGMLINLPSILGLDIGLGFSNIHGIISFIYIVGARLVGLVLMILSVWVSYNIITD